MGPATHDLPIRDVLISFVLLALSAILTIVSGLAGRATGPPAG